MHVFRIIRAIRSRFHDKRNNIIYWIKTIWCHHYKVDLGITPKWSLLEKIKYNRLGFTNEDYYNFNLRENDYHGYISYWERMKLENINGRFANILGEKLMFERIFGQFIRVPHIYCWVKDGKCIDLSIGEYTDIFSVLKNNRILISKPTRSCGGGVGVHKLIMEDEMPQIDGKPISPEELRKQISTWEENIFVEYIFQADYAKKVFPESTNTIRIITAKRKSGTFEILMAFHRFGTEENKPVDNYSSGGIFSCVDIGSGELGEGRRITEPDKVFVNHPDSGSQIKGVVIPNWERIKEKLLHVHQCFPYFNFFAWDVVICQNGEPYVLEINRGSDLAFQMVKPLRKEKLGEFMREYGLLDKW